MATTMAMSALNRASETTRDFSEGLPVHQSSGWIAGLREAGLEEERIATMLEAGEIKQMSTSLNVN